MKKNFKNINPALSYISAMQGEEQQEQETIQEQPTKKREQVEIKNRRVQIVLTPSRYKAIRTKAFQMELSVNEAINRAIEQFLNSRE